MSYYKTAACSAAVFACIIGFLLILSAEFAYLSQEKYINKVGFACKFLLRLIIIASSSDVPRVCRLAVSKPHRAHDSGTRASPSSTGTRHRTRAWRATSHSTTMSASAAVHCVLVLVASVRVVWAWW